MARTFYWMTNSNFFFKYHSEKREKKAASPLKSEAEIKAGKEAAKSAAKAARVAQQAAAEAAISK